jgi:hypothetical protein
MDGMVGSAGMTLEGARRVDQAIREEWDTRMRAHETRVAGYDDLFLDPDRQLAVWRRAGMLVLETPAELIGSYAADLGLFRWWWSGKENALKLAPARLDRAFAHAQETDLRALLTRQHQLEDENEAAMLCRVAAYYAQATAMVRQPQGDRVNYFAVFAANTRPPIVPDLDIVRTLPPPAVMPRVPDLDLGPRPSASASAPAPAPSAVREPARALLLPLVHIARGLLRRTFGERARRALVIVTVDTARDKARFFVTLVGSNDAGELAAIDTTRDLLDAAGVMLGEDARSGNGRWRKLVVHVECAGAGAEIARCEVGS